MAEYDWLIPRNRFMRALYDATENRPVRYALTWPLWFGRYHWLAHRGPNAQCSCCGCRKWMCGCSCCCGKPK